MRTGEDAGVPAVERRRVRRLIAGSGMRRRGRRGAWAARRRSRPARRARSAPCRPTCPASIGMPARWLPMRWAMASIGRCSSTPTRDRRARPPRRWAPARRRSKCAPRRCLASHPPQWSRVGDGRTGLKRAADSRRRASNPAACAFEFGTRVRYMFCMSDLPTAFPLRDLFDVAARGRAVRLTCAKCRHGAVLSSHALWWLFHRKGWVDTFREVRRRCLCLMCLHRRGKKVRGIPSSSWSTTRRPTPACRCRPSSTGNGSSGVAGRAPRRPRRDRGWRVNRVSTIIEPPSRGACRCRWTTN